MKKIYTLLTSLMNGTVTMVTESACFSSKELAEKAKVAVENANKNVSIWQTIQETNLYESEDEVPILNQTQNECNS